MKRLAPRPAVLILGLGVGPQFTEYRVQLMCPQRTCRRRRLSLRALTSRANNLNISPLLYVLRSS